MKKRKFIWFFFGLLILNFSGVKAEGPVNLDNDNTIYYTSPQKKVELSGKDAAILKEAIEAVGKSTIAKEDESSQSTFKYQQTPPKLQCYTGTVRIVRTSPVAEAFFLDINQSFVIPKTDAYYQIYNEMLKSQKTKKPVSFLAEPKTRVIYSTNLEEQKKEGDLSKSPSGK
jgi:hypothetical protein